MNRLQHRTTTEQEPSDVGESPTRMVPAEQLSALLREPTVAADSLEDASTSTSDPLIERTVHDDDDLLVTGSFAADVLDAKLDALRRSEPARPRLADVLASHPPIGADLAPEWPRPQPEARRFEDLTPLEDNPFDEDGPYATYSRTVVLTGTFSVPSASSIPPPPSFPVPYPSAAPSHCARAEGTPLPSSSYPSYPSQASHPSIPPAPPSQQGAPGPAPAERPRDSLLGIAVCGMFALAALIIAIGTSPMGKSAWVKVFGHAGPSVGQAALR